MKFYEVWPADSRYRADRPLTYSYDEQLKPRNVVTIELQKRLITGFVKDEVAKPGFQLKPIKNVLSTQPLPEHCMDLAVWMQEYYCCSISDALRQLAPTKPAVRQVATDEILAKSGELQLNIESPLTNDQAAAINQIKKNPSTTILLHGETGSGKTRVYLELAKETLANAKSVLLVTPEISLITQLENAAIQLGSPVYVLHSRLTASKRKKIWLAILESQEAVVVIGPRSALFSPVQKLGLIVMDEAHEPAYKQESSPRYLATRVASQLGKITGAKVILGTATPSVTDYYLADKLKAVVRMQQPAVGQRHSKAKVGVVDTKKREVFTRSQYISKPLLEAIGSNLSSNKQVMIYLNKRGSARSILCNNCGWQLLCPNCDIPLIYHGDQHLTRCHTCGHTEKPPTSCPQCQNDDIIYRSIGVKALADELQRLFPNSNIKRFDSDNQQGEHLVELYPEIISGKIDILVGTQLLAKGLDLPKLGLVGVVAAESSLALPDYTAQERSFQLLYQVMGRVGRGHSAGQVIVQTYEPDSVVLKAAIARDYEMFYKQCLKGRQAFRFPPFSYLLKLSCHRATIEGAQKAAGNLKSKLQANKLPVEIIGPSPSFFSRRAGYYYWQIVVKSKSRTHLQELAMQVPADWTIDLDPSNLL